MQQQEQEQQEQEQRKKTISELLAINGRSVHGTDKTTTHAYGDLYDTMFEPYRDTAKRVLEIGIWGGASIFAFAQFFEGAEIDGVDIDLSRILYGLDQPRIRYHVADGCSPDTARMLREVGNRRAFDLIVEDASHIPDHQVATLDAFAPSLAPGGLYVIEDIGDVSVRPRLEEVAAKHGLAMTWHDLRGIKGQFDDVLATFVHV